VLHIGAEISIRGDPKMRGMIEDRHEMLSNDVREQNQESKWVDNTWKKGDEQADLTQPRSFH
jgi:hypothetical protein